MKKLFIFTLLISLASMQAVPTKSALPTMSVPQWFSVVRNNVQEGASNFASGFKDIAIGSSELFGTLGKGLKAFTKYQKTAAGATMALGAAAAYGIYSRYSSYDWKNTIAEANRYTQFLNQTPVDQPDTNLMMFWKNNANGEWPRPENILKAANKDLIINAIKIPSDAKAAKDFIVCKRAKINEEMQTLNKIKTGLEQCLNSCSLIPSLSYAPSSSYTPWIKEFINEQIRNTGKSYLYELTRQEEETISRALTQFTQASKLNIYKTFRRFVLPYEAAAIDQYWKISLLISRLQSLDKVLESIS